MAFLNILNVNIFFYVFPPLRLACIFKKRTKKKNFDQLGKLNPCQLELEI